MGLAIERWLQRLKKPPGDVAKPEEEGSPSSEPNRSSSDDAKPATEKPKPASPSDATDGSGNRPGGGLPANSEPASPTQPGEDKDTAKPQQPPDQPYTLPAQQPKGRSVPFHTGQDVVDNIKNALDNDWHDFLQGVGRVVDATHWMKDQTSNIIAAVDFYQGGPPYDLQDLIDAAKKPSEAGSQDHHIVEQGPQNDDLSPEDQELIDDSKNKIRLPVYFHQQLTNYYRNPDPNLPGNVTPRQYLRGKTFEDRYQFGLKVLREKFGVIK